MNRLTRITLGCGLAAAIAAGCSSSPSPTSCTPGAQAACACPNGQSAVQVCASDGTFGACQCGADDGGVEASADAGPCDFPNQSPQITATTQSGPPPAMTGGAIADGTYVLSSVVYYPGTPDQTVKWAADTMIVSGSSLQVVADFYDVQLGAQHRAFAASFTLAGTTLSYTETCNTGYGSLDYTATPTTFEYLDGVELDTFVKK